MHWVLTNIAERIKYILNKRGDIWCLQIKRLNIIKVAIFPKLIYRYDIITIKNIEGFLLKIISWSKYLYENAKKLEQLEQFKKTQTLKKFKKTRNWYYLSLKLKATLTKTGVLGIGWEYRCIKKIESSEIKPHM